MTVRRCGAGIGVDFSDRAAQRVRAVSKEECPMAEEKTGSMEATVEDVGLLEMLQRLRNHARLVEEEASRLAVIVSIQFVHPVGQQKIGATDAILGLLRAGARTRDDVVSALEDHVHSNARNKRRTLQTRVSQLVDRGVLVEEGGKLALACCA